MPLIRSGTDADLLRYKAPLVLAAQGCVTQATKDAVTGLGATSRVVLGGTAVVSAAAADLTTC